jgi:hypothetical protein
MVGLLCPRWDLNLKKGGSMEKDITIEFNAMCSAEEQNAIEHVGAFVAAHLLKEMRLHEVRIEIRAGWCDFSGTLDCLIRYNVYVTGLSDLPEAPPASGTGKPT